ncbi:MAG: pyridoxal-phosphate dependent enzyme [Chloroflexi bacterium]|nr:pyridoxal-phosphate dependent enzyme [Chloroflexota bacterium]
MHPHQILNAIADLPRIPLAHKNTPIEEMPRLRAAIAESMDSDITAVPPLFIKRDDTTGFAFGGNKARHMEFLFAHLIERGIDTIVNINHYDSNNARLAAAASAKTGMKYHWVAFDELDAAIQGNMLIAHLTGANIHRIPKDETRPYAESLLAHETNLGRNPTILLDNAFSNIAGMIAFLETAHELENQIYRYSETPSRHSRESGNPGAGPTTQPLSPTDPIHFWGLCGRSIAGIILYARNTGKPWTATAVAQPHYTPENYQELYLDRSTRVAELLNLDTPLHPGDISTLTGYTKIYGIPTDLGIEAMHLVAQTEAIILDPTYTAKSMSALIAEIRLGKVDPDIPVVFIHSGGQPQTFAFADQIWNHNA